MGTLVFWLALLAIVVSYMTIWYGLSLYTKRLDVVDCAWGMGFALVAWVSLAIRAHFGNVQTISAALVSLWGLRLFAHIGSRNWRKHTDDSRYEALRAKWGKNANTKAYTHIFLLQGILLMAVSLPMIVIAFAQRPANGLTYVGWVVWLFGICFEALADWQLATFLRARAKNSHHILDRGLWRYSRHPNYFGELTVWWGAAVVACSLQEWWGIVGAAVITLLITKISGIPLLEKHYDGNAQYQKYRKHTSVLVPWVKRKCA